MLKTITKWVRPPSFPGEEDKTRSALLLNVILNVFLVALPIFIVGIRLGNNTPRIEKVVLIVAVAWLAIFTNKLLIVLGRVSAAGVFAVVIIFISTTLVVYHLGTIRAPATAIYLLAIVTAGLTVSRRAILWTSGASSLVILLFLFAEKNGYLPPPDLTVSITQATTFIVVFAIVSFLLYLAVESIEQSLARVRQELVERKQTEAALQHSTAQLEILHEIDRSLLAARSLQEIADDALIRVRRLIPCPRASLTFFDMEKQEASFLAASFIEPIQLPSTPISFKEFGQRVVDKLLQNQPWIVNNILEDPEVTELDIRLVNEYGIHAWLSVPLLSQGQLIGALNLGRGAGDSFQEREVDIAQDIADQLAIAIQQTNLYHALEEELAERKRLIQQLEANNAELERFTYTVSHDLRNPLVTIKGFLGMLERDIRENRPEHIASDFQRISNAADKMQALLVDLLELSRIGRIINPASEVNLSEVAIEAVDTLDGRIRSKNISVSVSLDLPTVAGDRIRLREVFENLIDNAAKYMGDQEDPLIEIGCRDEGERVIFVKDNGMGIEESYRTRIFGLFEKLNPTSEGTGIGLALIKRIIEVHGGRIWVESEGLGTGSTFCFTIPDCRLDS
jgi:signal transduction histidine kinase/large-conductance mechanosensitive channel